MATLTVDREKAKSLLVEIGLSNAVKYSDAKLIGTLSSLDVTDDTVNPGKFRKLYDKIVKANQAGKDIAVDGEPVEVEAPVKAKKGKKAAAEVVEEAPKGKKGKKGKASANGEAESNGKAKAKAKAKKTGEVIGRNVDKNGYTAKDRVYLEWQKRGDSDKSRNYEDIQKKANAESVQLGTISSWCSSWRNNRGLPRVATRES
jgi:hypothetical protein